MGLYELRQKFNDYEFSKKINSSKVGRAVDVLSYYTPRPSSVIAYTFYTLSGIIGFTAFVGAIPAFAMGAEDDENLDILLLPSVLLGGAFEHLSILGNESKEKLQKLERICLGSRGY